jgi:prepilin-type N-terminal cleavage/methylation domain-containing protein/prepilin-type processing-associated H-X9-DG protein
VKDNAMTKSPNNNTLMPNRTRSQRCTTAFTLIELLVVIAIIGILASLLLPALAQAREKARTANCVSNLKQVAVCINLYVDDWAGYMPPASVIDGASGQSITWPKTLGAYVPKLGPTATSRPNRMFICPSAIYPGVNKSDISLTYACTSAMLGPTASSPCCTAQEPRKQSTILTPIAETPLIVEGKRQSGENSSRSNFPWTAPYASTDLSSGGPGACFYLDFRHNDGMNILYCDGSVRITSFAQAKAKFTKSIWEGR